MSGASLGCCGITRRGFLLGAGAGLATGAAGYWFARDGWKQWFDHGPSPFTGKSREVKNPAHAMPGPFPGRVVEVRHPGAVRDDYSIDQGSVSKMMQHGMCQLTGADHAGDAWKRFFSPGDRVGIKVNPVGRKRQPTDIGSISSFEVLREIILGLRSAGVASKDIIVFERYAVEFLDAEYEKKVLRANDMQGVRWFASSWDYDNLQMDIEGYDSRPQRHRYRNPHVTGYDPDVFVSMGFGSEDEDRTDPSGPLTVRVDPLDDRRFRSHLSLIVTRMVDKIINIPCLKDHRSAGVTLALKNLSHGLNNNVARSHLSPFRTRTGEILGPNQCNTFIPTAVAQAPTRQKTVLHIMDGLIGVYEGGPGSWNSTWATWRHQGLFFATDPVAMDHVCWDVIDTKRAFEGWQPVAKMGLLSKVPAVTLSPRLAALAGLGRPEAAAVAIDDYQKIPDGSASEGFNLRTPDHIILAGQIGLGTWDARQIEHRRRTWDPIRENWATT
jgi:uncharacterized protein (DUF362 family)